MYDAPAVVIDDEESHAAGLAATLQAHDMACEPVHFTGLPGDVAARPDVRFILVDLHLVPGTRDAKADFTTIGGLLQNSIKPVGPYAIMLWTSYPEDAEGLRRFLMERLDSIPKPVSVYALTKLVHLDEGGHIRNEEELFDEVKEAIDEAEMLIRNQPKPDDIKQALGQLFGEPEDKSFDARDSKAPGLDVRLEDWMQREVPGAGKTPMAMLESDNPGDLFLLERMVHSIATLRASRHPRFVRDVVRKRIERMYEDGISLEAIGGPHVGERRTPYRKERWMDTKIAAFGDRTPRQFFDSDKVDVACLEGISARLDGIDEGAFS